MKIDINKKYKTRDGKEVRIYAIDGGYGDRVHGAMKPYDNRSWELGTWDAQGRYGVNVGHAYDLIEVKEKKQLTGKVVFFKDGSNYYFEDDSLIKDIPTDNIIAIIDLSQYGIFYEEGKGL